MKKSIAALAAIVFILGACGSDSGGSDSGGGDSGGSASSDSIYVEPLAAELASGDSPMTLEEATCAAEKIVGEISDDRFAELGMTVDALSSVEDLDFTDDEVDVILDSFSGCFDLKAAMATQFASDGTFSEDDANCIADELGEEQLKNAMRAGLTGDEDPAVVEAFQSAIIDAFGACNVVPG